MPIMASFESLTGVNTDGVIAGDVVDPTKFGNQEGKEIADWFIVNSKGKGHAWLLRADESPLLAGEGAGFSAEVKAKCPSCTVTTEDMTLADVNAGKAVPAAVSALQSDPSINYAVTVDGAFFTGLPQQLQSLGLSKRVQVAGIQPTTTNLTDVQNGIESAYVQNSITMVGWGMVDAALRHAEGMPIPTSEKSVPSELDVHGGKFVISNSYDEPSNYAKQYEKLWKVS